MVSGDSNQLDLEGGLYVGGIPPLTHTLPPALWSGILSHGYVGCMRDLVTNGNAVDIAEYAKQQDSGNHLLSYIFRSTILIEISDK